MALVSARRVDRRDFEGWMVGFAGHSDDLDALHMRYGAAPKLDPTQLSVQSAIDLMHDFGRLDGGHFVPRSFPGGGAREPARRSAA